MSEQWRNYSEERPKVAGVYEWRIPSTALPGEIITFHTHMRMRGAGHEDIISPVFDYWDGYRVLIPKGTQWRSANPSVKCEKHGYTNIAIEGLTFSPCIYCGKTPMLRGVVVSSGGGVVVCGKPHQMNTWWLQCCAWGNTPHISSPREIERIRKAAIERAKAMT